MSKQKGKNNLLNELTDSYNNLTDDRENDMLPVDSLIHYKNHPFRLYEGSRFADMVRSIKERGVLLPIIVRPIDNADNEQYEILSGHNRVNAAKEAGLSEVPAIIKHNLSDDEAELIVTETNLVQRSFADLSYSERAVALKRHMDAISKQGKRNDLLDEIEMLSNPDEIKANGTSALIEPKLTAREKTAEKYGLSRANVTRYLRLSYLIKPLLERIDNEEIGLYPAVSLSYLPPDEQNEVNRILGETKYKINIKKAESLRNYSESKKLSNDMILQILSGELNKKPKTKTPASFKLKGKILTKYFSGKKAGEIEAEIIEAIEFLRANKK